MTFFYEYTNKKWEFLSVMNRKRKIIVSIPFNNLYFKPRSIRCSEDWIRNRLDLLFTYALPSLVNQSNQDFLAYVLIDPSSEEFIQKQLHNYHSLPDNIHFVAYPAKILYYPDTLEDCDTLYAVRLDSDNCFEKDYIEHLASFEVKSDTQAIMTEHGYIYLVNEKQLYSCYMPSVAFQCFIYHYENGIAVTEEHTMSHEYITRLLRCEFLPQNNFIISIHDTNTLLRKKIIEKEILITDTSIYENFGLHIVS